MKHLHRKYTGSPQFSSDQCSICERDLAEGERVLDHCHASGKSLGYAHDKCNLKRRTVNYIPIFVHNLLNYDLHFLQKSTPFPKDSKNQVNPITDEKYISLSIGIRIASSTARRGVEKHIYEYLRFVDSFQDGQVSITPKNFQHATKAFQKFGCATLGSCNDLYLTSDTLLLACVVEQFRKVTYSTYGLDSAHYYTCSHLFGDAFPKS